MTVVLFEDHLCSLCYPLGLFKPLYTLRVGSFSLRDLVGMLGLPVKTLIRPHFTVEDETVPALVIPDGEPVLFLNAAVEPDIASLATLRKIVESGDAFISTSGNRVAAAMVPPGKKFSREITTATISSLLLELDLPLEQELFRTIDWPHGAVDAHLRLFMPNLEALLSRGNYREERPGLFLADGAVLSPLSAVDTTRGPVVLDEGVEVRHFSYLEGPVHVGARSRICEHAAVKDRTCIGLRCKVGGEVEASVILSYSNKQHHGFLGHSWVGNWVNLGAGTTTSDLKNTYGTVNIDYGGTRVSTGMQFLGSIIGSYSKTAVNSTLYTGKVIGVCSMVYGTVTSAVPSFSNYARSFGQITEVSLEQTIRTQKRMFERRGVEQTARDCSLMQRVFDLTRHERSLSDEPITF